MQPLTIKEVGWIEECSRIEGLCAKLAPVIAQQVQDPQLSQIFQRVGSQANQRLQQYGQMLGQPGRAGQTPPPQTRQL